MIAAQDSPVSCPLNFDVPYWVFCFAGDPIAPPWGIRDFLDRSRITIITSSILCPVLESANAPADPTDALISGTPR